MLAIRLILIIMIILSIIVVFTTRLRVAVIYSGIFSLLSAFIYTLLQAPDVALAEAIIGSTFSTILFLAALKKCKSFNIYCLGDKDKSLLIKMEKILKIKELELHEIHSNLKKEDIIKNHEYDMILDFNTYEHEGNEDNEIYLKLSDTIEKHKKGRDSL